MFTFCGTLHNEQGQTYACLYIYIYIHECIPLCVPRGYELSFSKSHPHLQGIPKQPPPVPDASLRERLNVYPCLEGWWWCVWRVGNALWLSFWASNNLTHMPISIGSKFTQIPVAVTLCHFPLCVSHWVRLKS